MSNPLLAPGNVRAALHGLGVRPTRGMGQNFLIDAHALEQIVAAAELSSADTVLEIGPGLGGLTWELLRTAGQVVAVELDKRLVARLHETFADQPHLRIVQGDILQLAPGALLDNRRPTTNDHRSTTNDQRPLTTDNRPTTTDNGSRVQPSAFSLQPYKVVANLPYAITSPVLRHLLEATTKPTLIVVLVQWEVAERIAAKPGDLSILAHSVQLYAEPEIIAKVPSSSFVPSPAVDSAILRLRVRARPAVEVDSIDGLMHVIKAGFLQGRKKLRNALPSGLTARGAHISKEQAIAALLAADVNPDRRAETVSLAEWAAVYRALSKVTHAE